MRYKNLYQKKPDDTIWYNIHLIQERWGEKNPKAIKTESNLG